MLMIAEHLDLIKRQVEYYARMREKATERERQQLNSANAARSSEKLAVYDRLHKSFAGLYQAMLEDVESHRHCDLSVHTSARKDESNEDSLERLLSRPTSIIPSNLSGLPADLIDQLQISDSDRFQWDVVGLIDRTPDKTISIEVLLIALYRLTQKIYDRTDLANRIYRLTRKGILFGVSGKKGWYTTNAQDGELVLTPPNDGEDDQ